MHDTYIKTIVAVRHIMKIKSIKMCNVCNESYHIREEYGQLFKVRCLRRDLIELRVTEADETTAPTTVLRRDTTTTCPHNGVNIHFSPSKDKILLQEIYRNIRFYMICPIQIIQVFKI